jgi:stage V sporulation protein B
MMRSSRNFIVIGSLILTFSNISVRVLSYVYRILMGRLLSPYEYGLLNLALPIQFMVIVLASAGIAPSIARFVSEAKAKGEDLRLLTSSVIFYYTLAGIGMGLVFFILGTLFGRALFGDVDVVLPLQISAFAVPFGIIVSTFTGIFQGLKRVTYMSGVLLFEQAFRVIFGAVFVIVGYGVFGAIGGSTIGFILAVPLSYFLFKGLGLSIGEKDFGIFKEVFYFSIPTSITALSSFTLAYADILLIGFYMAPGDVGIYSAASPVSRLMLAFTMALYAVLIPSVSEVSAKGSTKDVIKYFKVSLSGLSIVIFPIALVSLLYSKEVIRLLFSDVYLNAVPSFQVLVVGVAFLSLFMINSAIFQGIGMPKVPMKILIIFASLDILLNIALIPKYGVIGAAMSTALASVGAGVASTALLAKYLNTIG